METRLLSDGYAATIVIYFICKHLGTITLVAAAVLFVFVTNSPNSSRMISQRERAYLNDALRDQGFNVSPTVALNLQTILTECKAGSAMEGNFDVFMRSC